MFCEVNLSGNADSSFLFYLKANSDLNALFIVYCALFILRYTWIYNSTRFCLGSYKTLRFRNKKKYAAYLRSISLFVLMSVIFVKILACILKYLSTSTKLRVLLYLIVRGARETRRCPNLPFSALSVSSHPSIHPCILLPYTQQTNACPQPRGNTQKYISNCRSFSLWLDKYRGNQCAQRFSFFRSNTLFIYKCVLTFFPWLCQLHVFVCTVYSCLLLSRRRRAGLYRSTFTPTIAQINFSVSSFTYRNKLNYIQIFKIYCMKIHCCTFVKVYIRTANCKIIIIIYCNTSF